MTKQPLSSTDYPNPWIYRGVSVDPNNLLSYFGFVYEITDKETGKKYVGRKYIWSKKREKGSLRRKKVESDWRTYYSSHIDLKKIGKDNPFRLQREILHLCQGQRRNKFSRD